MKKIIIAIGILAFCLAGLLTYKIVQKFNRNKIIAKEKQALPVFQFYDQDLQKFSATQLQSNVPVCIFYYNAECEHCDYEAKEIRKHIRAFEKAQVVMVSTNIPKETAQFINAHQLKDYAFITWLYDKEYNFYKWFGKSVTPSVYIYNEQHELVKEYTGEVKISAVLKYLDHEK
ncbi:peroxiredoxin family protein [Pedobacter sp. N23S346]|uniref:peroxiredoxin family protein n=1 Tax=Pedobacter sp. N23S346 TaxID=3402750 RepID=UPI003AC2E655